MMLEIMRKRAPTDLLLAMETMGYYWAVDFLTGVPI
jgi:hypothetical protein